MNNSITGQSTKSLSSESRLVYAQDTQKISYMVRDQHVVTDGEGNLVREPTAEDKRKMLAQIDEKISTVDQAWPHLDEVCRDINQRLKSALPLMRTVNSLQSNRQAGIEADTDFTLTSHQKELEEQRLTAQEAQLELLKKSEEDLNLWRQSLSSRLMKSSKQIKLLIASHERLGEERKRDQKRLEAYQASLGGARDRLAAFRRRKQEKSSSAGDKEKKSEYQIRFEENSQRNQESQRGNDQLLDLHIAELRELIGEFDDDELYSWSSLDSDEIAAKMNSKVSAGDGQILKVDQQKEQLERKKTNLEQEIERLAASVADIARKWSEVKGNSQSSNELVQEQQQLLNSVTEQLKLFESLLSVISLVRSAVQKTKSLYADLSVPYQVFDLPLASFEELSRKLVEFNDRYTDALWKDLYQGWMKALMVNFKDDQWLSADFRSKEKELEKMITTRREAQLNIDLSQRNPTKAIEEFFGITAETNGFAEITKMLEGLMTLVFLEAREQIKVAVDLEPILSHERQVEEEFAEAQSFIAEELVNFQEGWFARQIEVAESEGRMAVEHQLLDTQDQEKLLVKLSSLDQDSVDKVVLPILRLIITDEENLLLDNIKTGKGVKISFGEPLREPNIFTIKPLADRSSTEEKPVFRGYITDTTPDLDDPVLDEAGILAKFVEIVALIRANKLEQLSVKVESVEA